jgi:hypothetical protein
MPSFFLAQETSPGTVVLLLAIIVLVVAGMWRAFAKAGQPGWAAIVPIYNTYVMTQIAGRPGWWLILFFIPIVNFVVLILMCLDIATRFGKGAGFGIGLALLGMIFWPILGFGSATYRRPAMATA